MGRNVLVKMIAVHKHAVVLQLIYMIGSHLDILFVVLIMETFGIKKILLDIYIINNTRLPLCMLASKII